MYTPEPRRLLRKTTTNFTADGVTDTLLFDVVPLDQQWFVDWISIINVDAGITSWYPFIHTGSYDYPIKQSADTAQNIRHGLQVQTWLTGGEQFGVVIKGATAGNDLYAWLIGHYRTVGE